MRVSGVFSVDEGDGTRYRLFAGSRIQYSAALASSNTLDLIEPANMVPHLVLRLPFIRPASRLQTCNAAQKGLFRLALYASWLTSFPHSFTCLLNAADLFHLQHLVDYFEAITNAKSQPHSIDAYHSGGEARRLVTE